MGETPIRVAYPAADDPHLRIALGACRLEAKPGEGQDWIVGTYHDPTDGRPLRIIEEETGATITEEQPSFGRVRAAFGGATRYELEFGKTRPFALTIETGASDFDLDLGGVPLSRLAVRQGAGKFELDFSQPNPARMGLLEVSTGAAAIELENLANANFSEMRLSGGAAGYELDFGGTLAHDAEASIETGVTAVEAGTVRAGLHRGEGDRGDHAGQRGRGRWLHHKRGRLLYRTRPERGRPRSEDPRRRTARISATQNDVSILR
jgi:hypothetical protein